MNNLPNDLPELTRAEEEANLQKVLDLCKARLNSVKQDAKVLEEELHSMQEDFDESDKEQQVLWHNADSRFQEVKREIQRAGQMTKKPYFGRIDFAFPEQSKREAYYIGRNGISSSPSEQVVIDWRAPIASVYYESNLGKASYSVQGEGKMEIDLLRKRTYVIEKEELKDYYDSEVVANDELLTKYLSKNKGSVLSEIIATIQAEQNEVIRMKPQHNIIIQGAAGSGKTTVAMHRISYILYNYELEFKPEDFYVIGSNQVLLNYITGVLPELNVYGVRQMTMEQLFVRLLYEQWDPKTYGIKAVVKGVTEPVKGTGKWFRALEKFAREYEWNLIPQEDVILEKTQVTLMSSEMIRNLLERFDKLSRADMIDLLNERVLGKLENEISGKYYSYSQEEKKKYRREYSQYFGRRKWNGSIYELYDEFLRKQAEAGIVVVRPEREFDVYDLAALAYLYKRLIETEIIREAGHVVIDEAQDFGMMAYHCLKYCLSKCTYTIMGDVAQNIYMDYGLNDWSELRKVMLPDEFDYFGLLRKSYRNTIEISDFATGILQHGTFQVYPVQPIIRHGEPVKLEGCKGEKELLEKCLETIQGWKEKSLETIAVVCTDWDAAEHVKEELGKHISLLPVSREGGEFGNGVAVLPLELTKGLEFDAVIIYDCSKENYPSEDGLVKRLYVAATRALHELSVLYQGELSGLISDPISEEQKQKTITEAPRPKKRFMPVEEEKTKEELAREQAVLGEAQMQERHYIGPRRISVSDSAGLAKSKLPVVRTKKVSGTDQDGRMSTLAKNDGKDAQKQEENQMRKAVASNAARRKNVISLKPSVKIPTYLDEQLDRGVTGSLREKRKNDLTAGRPIVLQEFGSMPEQKDLTVPGHARLDHSIKMSLKGKDYVELVTGYGTLHLEPMNAGLFRVCFAKGAGMNFPAPTDGFKKENASYQYKESRDTIEISTELIKVVISKKTGELTFWDRGKGKLLASEKSGDPRLVTNSACYVFWNWAKKESLMAKPPSGQLPLSVGNSAKYISFGENDNDTPGLHSDQGYELWFPAKRKTMCCNIGVYGQYLCQEGECAEYYFSLPNQKK